MNLLGWFTIFGGFGYFIRSILQYKERRIFHPIGFVAIGLFFVAMGCAMIRALSFSFLYSHPILQYFILSWSYWGFYRIITRQLAVWRLEAEDPSIKKQMIDTTQRYLGAWGPALFLMFLGMGISLFRPFDNAIKFGLTLIIGPILMMFLIGKDFSLSGLKHRLRFLKRRDKQKRKQEVSKPEAPSQTHGEQPPKLDEFQKLSFNPETTVQKVDSLFLHITAIFSFVFGFLNTLLSGLLAVLYFLPLLIIYGIAVWVGYLLGAIRRDWILGRVRGWIYLLTGTIPYIYIYGALLTLDFRDFLGSWLVFPIIFLFASMLFTLNGLKTVPRKILTFYEKSIPLLQSTPRSKRPLEQTYKNAWKLGIFLFLYLLFITLNLTRGQKEWIPQSLKIGGALLFTFFTGFSLYMIITQEKGIQFRSKRQGMSAQLFTTVAWEMRHLAKGEPNSAQAKLRKYYKRVRIDSLTQRGVASLYGITSKECTLKLAIMNIKKKYPDFEPEYDKEFFNLDECKKSFEK